MKTLFLILSIICISYRITYSQNDSMYSEGSSEGKELRYDRYYKLFLEDRDREINHLWKFDFVGFSLVIPNIGFEQRLGERWSSNTSLEGGLYTDEISYGRVVWDSEIWYFGLNALALTGTQEFRYYHNLLRRERLGRKTNGFSGNFFALSLSSGFSIHLDYKGYDFTHYSAGIYYGIQRRIGNIGFIEGYTGFLAYRYATHNLFLIGTSGKINYSVNAGIKAGFAIDSFKNLKRMLK